MLTINPESIKIILGVKFTNNIYLIDTVHFNKLYKSHLCGAVFAKPDTNNKTQMKFITVRHEREFLQFFDNNQIPVEFKCEEII